MDSGHSTNPWEWISNARKCLGNLLFTVWEEASGCLVAVVM